MIKYYILLLRWYFQAIIYEISIKLSLSSFIQKYRLLKVVKYAKIHIPYFVNILTDKKLKYINIIQTLQSLPLIDKSIIRNEEYNIYSDEINSNWGEWQNTGGSTGSPLVFPVLKRDCMTIYDENIHQLLVLRKMGYKLGDIICSVDGSRLPEDIVQKGIYWRKSKYNFPYGKIHFSTIYLNEETATSYINELNKLRPDIIRGYPSGVKTLCDFIQLYNIKLEFKLKAIYLTSENFDTELCTYISSVFGCEVWGQYGHSECSVFGVRRPNDNKYYISPLYGFTEILNEDGKHVNSGEQGEIVVTGFINYGLPFIRYKTGDLAIYGGKKSNGVLVIDELLGRSVDYIIDKNGIKHYLVGLIFGGHLKAFSYIRQWQIEQSEKGKVILRIIKDTSWQNTTEQEIIDFFNSYGFEIDIHYVSYIKKTIGGKQRFLIQNL